MKCVTSYFKEQLKFKKTDGKGKWEYLRRVCHDLSKTAKDKAEL